MLMSKEMLDNFAEDNFILEELICKDIKSLLMDCTITGALRGGQRNDMIKVNI